jgi:TolA-binding protein
MQIVCSIAVAVAKRKSYSDEDYAKSRFNVAHMLWQNGKAEASRRNLEQLIDDYPKTDAAELAKGVLERF